MDELKWIENYLVYLISECGFLVTLHAMEKETLITFSALGEFNTHDNPFCTQIKSSKAGWERCLLQQRKILKKMQEHPEPFCGCCHAGVFEFVYPIQNAERVIGFISVSGFASAEGEARVEKACRAFGYSEEKLRKAYLELKKNDVDRARMDTLILPLCTMLELAYRKEKQTEKKEDLMKQILRYIQMHYSAPLSAEEICKYFGCSRSYFSHSFKQKTGMGFREYLMEVRLKNAKRLLSLSHLNINEISFSVGFSDANYFSNVFKKKEGISPMAFRKQSKK